MEGEKLLWLKICSWNQIESKLLEATKMNSHSRSYHNIKTTRGWQLLWKSKQVDGCSSS
jgi:hypothetical protein